jgi:hypothetical protein
MRLLTVLLLALLLVPVSSTAQAQHVWPWPGYLHEACDQWIAEHPDFYPITDNLPLTCLFHYAGWDCEQDWTPVGWLRPGGYCDQVKSTKSIAATGSGSAPPRHHHECPTYPYPTMQSSYCPK